MNIAETKIITLPLSALHPNEGQLEPIGVNANPRTINENDYDRLKRSLQEDNLTGVLPLKVYQYESRYYVLGGNMRLRAMQELGMAECACIEIPQDTPPEVLNKIIILDNSTLGDWDFDALANWDAPFADWGVDLPKSSSGELQDHEISTDADFIVEVTCDDETAQEQLYNEMTQRGYACRVLTL